MQKASFPIWGFMCLHWTAQQLWLSTQLSNSMLQKYWQFQWIVSMHNGTRAEKKQIYQLLNTRIWKWNYQKCSFTYQCSQFTQINDFNWFAERGEDRISNKAVDTFRWNATLTIFLTVPTRNWSKIKLIFSNHCRLQSVEILSKIGDAFHGYSSVEPRAQYGQWGWAGVFLTHNRSQIISLSQTMHLLHTRNILAGYNRVSKTVLK